MPRSTTDVPTLARPGDQTPSSVEVLVATADGDLAEAAARWCAAVGASAVMVDDVARARLRWRGAEVVLVGADLAASLAPVSRRDHVLLVGAGRAVDAGAVVDVGASVLLDVRDDATAVMALGDALDGGRDGCVLVVVGAVGGAGASTAAAGLALAAAHRGFDAVLVDDDPCGGGLDLVLGAEDEVGARWPDLDSGGGTWGARALRRALPARDGVSVLSWSRRDRSGSDDGDVPPPPSDGGRGDADLAAAVRAARRAFDLVVVDLPRHRLADRDDVLAEAVACLVLAPDDVRSVAAARELGHRLDQVVDTVLVASVDRPGGSGPTVLSDLLGRPVLGRVRASRRVRAAVDAGRGVGAWAAGRRVADPLLDLLGLDARRGAR